MIELICVDVDGTMVGSSGDVASETWAATARMRARGVRLAICSGRPAFGKTRGYAERLDADGWHMFQNGASVIRLPLGTTHSRPIEPALVRALIERARATGRSLELYGDTGYAVETDVPRAREHARLLGLSFVVSDLLAFGSPVVRAQWLLPHDEVEAVMSEPHEGLTLSHSLSPVMPDASFLNVTPSGVDKGEAVRAVARAYDVPLEHVMMVGDGANDVPALRIVGAAVAMGNAERAAREAAHFHVGDVDRGGLVEALTLALTL
ncbi:MAG: HAD-IIB family hydrolase [Gemmatimonadaceae bacterium]|nr:HAD-IIB family hydrolase [Gemmatimonadaceae bacterium]